jgi:hypothetical protein
MACMFVLLITIKQYKMELTTKFRELERKYGLDIETIPYEYYDDLQDAKDFESYFEELEYSTHQTECIYYSNAMKYLTEHDTSLNESLEIASEMGYEVEDLNSELLATLLMQRKESEALYDAKDDLEDLYNEFIEYKKQVQKEYEQ